MNIIIVIIIIIKLRKGFNNVLLFALILNIALTFWLNSTDIINHPTVPCDTFSNGCAVNRFHRRHGLLSHVQFDRRIAWKVDHRNCDQPLKIRYIDYTKYARQLDRFCPLRQEGDTGDDGRNVSPNFRRALSDMLTSSEWYSSHYLCFNEWGPIAVLFVQKNRHFISTCSFERCVKNAEPAEFLPEATRADASMQWLTGCFSRCLSLRNNSVYSSIISSKKKLTEN